jgi:hypothetical protein
MSRSSASMEGFPGTLCGWLAGHARRDRHDSGAVKSSATTALPDRADSWPESCSFRWTG